VRECESAKVREISTSAGRFRPAGSFRAHKDCKTINPRRISSAASRTIAILILIGSTRDPPAPHPTTPGACTCAMRIRPSKNMASSAT
jgi:hypothetical protein